ncbi:MAG TPA: methyltransferase domain-containing protein [Bryobacteraceae bacterium]|nr:methyltransferase domain-containing protein [Bryobacteraceae bacterium]
MAIAALHSYDKRFFDDMEAGALRSAQAVLPMVFDLLSPRSLIDIGCGRGAWLRTAMDLGIRPVCGLDGAYVDRRDLLIPRQCFLETDLSRPFQVPGRYHLALCLEVAEHLPYRSSRSLIAGLTAAAPAVLFSAAIPGQPGTRHRNPQFPEFWRKLFAEHDYLALDPIRSRIRDNAGVEPWYSQNMLLYVARSCYQQTPRLQAYEAVEDPCQLLPWVYGGIWRGRVRWRGPLSVLKILLSRVSRAQF